MAATVHSPPVELLVSNELEKNVNESNFLLNYLDTIATFKLKIVGY